MPKPKPSPRVEESPQETVAAERSNILIVDDRSDKRVVFRTILEELEQNIVTVGSGEEALRWLLDNDSAVILLDVNMPGMDGSRRPSSSARGASPRTRRSSSSPPSRTRCTRRAAIRSAPWITSCRRWCRTCCAAR
jgi:hypothetical protein